MKDCLLGLFCFLCPFFLEGQSDKIGDLVQGFIITNQGDTLHGKIKIGEKLERESRVFFQKRDLNKGFAKIKKYKTPHLKGYAFKATLTPDALQKEEKWYFFERQPAEEPPQPFKSDLVFMEVKVKGYAELYSYHVKHNSSDSDYHYYYFRKAGNPLLIKVSKENFTTFIEKHLSDCKGLFDKIGKADLQFAQLKNYILKYNECYHESQPSKF